MMQHAQLLIRSLLISALFCTSLSAKIFYNVPNVAALYKIVSKDLNPQRDMFVSDMNDVLIMPEDVLLQSQNKPLFRSLKEEYAQKYGKEVAAELTGIIAQTRKDRPVESEMVRFLKDLQVKGARLLVLTNCWSGPVGNIPHMEEMVMRSLRECGYDFSRGWKIPEKLTLTDVISKKPGLRPLYYKGVIFGSGADKGEVLQAFLKVARFRPMRVFFVDDKVSHLKSLEKAVEELGMEFIGIEYTYYKQHKFPKVDLKRARLQMEILAKDKKWVRDVELNKYVQK